MYYNRIETIIGVIFFQKQSVPDTVETVELDSVEISKEEVKFYAEDVEYCCAMTVLKEYLDLKLGEL